MARNIEIADESAQHVTNVADAAANRVSDVADEAATHVSDVHNAVATRHPFEPVHHFYADASYSLARQARKG